MYYLAKPYDSAVIVLDVSLVLDFRFAKFDHFFFFPFQVLYPILFVRNTLEL